MVALAFFASTLNCIPVKDSLARRLGQESNNGAEQATLHVFEGGDAMAARQALRQLAHQGHGFGAVKRRRAGFVHDVVRQLTELTHQLKLFTLSFCNLLHELLVLDEVVRDFATLDEDLIRQFKGFLFFLLLGWLFLSLIHI